MTDGLAVIFLGIAVAALAVGVSQLARAVRRLQQRVTYLEHHPHKPAQTVVTRTITRHNELTGPAEHEPTETGGN